MCRPDAAPTTPAKKGHVDDDVHAFLPIVYTEEELEAMRQVKAKMMEADGIEESRIGLCFLAMTTINCKLRVDEAAKKYAKFLDILSQCGMPDGVDDDLWKPDAAKELNRYKVCGTDHGGCSIFYIKNESKEGLIVDDDRLHAQGCIMYNLAIHADARTLRNGITFVIDTSGNKPKFNNKKLQKLHQSFPTRPKNIMIMGTSTVSRVIINAAIKLASVFTKQKILDRIEFVTGEDVLAKMPLESAPTCLGGNAGGYKSVAEWTKERLAKFPVPEL
mmetsp:Transcript_2008/g.4968  ORF Transcript_2008/g.4968 Transcript_2008/m.4968 type:complete len:275 (+) Transcript_2008:134-958(+)|eukprot:CAMPEP_0119545598 /NCGR_PEP_ID=MMETSP1352-20130426/301_1 /TAXON_ID=265584 /ORGANISM="Stauroneis constricta, Strain CCMP1120" /LENGTH=274 /DNA_ID=CAMNT_0007590165 /DNA_START=66 /DNA_END=890 /DNA_ORIENTATION=+